jgi:hypothetical protein
MAAKRYLSAIVAMSLSLAFLAAPANAGWDPVRFSKESTLDFLTVSPEDGEHWSRVWLVVIDSQVYIRLGARAAARIEGNTRAPTVSVRIGKEEFARVEAIPAPDMAEAVAEKMAEKYTTDILIRHLSHPLTMRLLPHEAP